MPAANAQACEDAAAFLKRVAGIEASRTAQNRPHCRKGRWLTIAVLKPEPGCVGAARAAAHARAGQDANAPCRGRHDIASAEPPWSAPTPATKPAATPAAPVLGQRSAYTAATPLASPTTAPAKAVNAGSDLALDADQPTARDQRQRNHHTQATRRPQKRSPKPHLSLTFPRGARHEEQRAGAARPCKHLSGGSVQRGLSGAGYVKSLARISSGAG